MSDIQAEQELLRREAKEAINHLFSRMGIRQVICVDDTYFDGDRIAKVISLCTKVDANILCSILGLDFIDLDNDEIWRQLVRERWSELDNEEKDAVFGLLIKEAKDENVDDTRNSILLADLLEGLKCETFSLEEWESKRDQILGLVQSQKMLFLFDEDFSGEGRSSTAGIKLIQDVLNTIPDDRVICGLLSGKYSPEDEYDSWERMTKEESIPQDKFVLLSKQRLASDPIGFARMVKLTVLNPNCKLLTEKISAIVDDAHQAAKSSIEQLNIYNYEQIVFQSSQNEGVWEPETLFRLFRLFHEKQARSSARKNVDVYGLAAKIRYISQVKTGLSESLVRTSWEIQRLELYDNDEDINPFHLPLEAGDIFQKGNKKFILLAQPCDLAVRQDGKRHHTVNEVTLARIVDSCNQNSDGKYYELKYFDKDTGESRYVDFRDNQAVKLDVLDLCVYQSDGSVKFKIGDGCPEGVIPSWSNRYERLAEALKKKIDSYCLYYAFLKESKEQPISDDSRRALKDALEYLLPQSSNGNLFKAEIDPTTQTVDFKVKRIGRLCQPHTGAMLTKFAQYSARAAFKHDFGKIR